MKVFQHAPLLSSHISKLKTQQLEVGFVPTMGALHEGHLSLIRNSVNKTDVSVCSIFVNPTQFNDHGDYQKYPVRIADDMLRLLESQTDIVFLPQVEDIYPSGVNALERYDLGTLDEILEAKFRPGHFQGVCQVMSRLLKIVQPSKLFMGQKDFQQCLVVKKLISILEMPIEFEMCDTVRENNGLAMSSRNLRLSNTDRERAASIFAALQFVSRNLKHGPVNGLKKEALAKINSQFTVDYLEIASQNSLDLISHWRGEPAVALFAGTIGGVRLIDNMLIPQNASP